MAERVGMAEDLGADAVDTSPKKAPVGVGLGAALPGSVDLNLLLLKESVTDIDAVTGDAEGYMEVLPLPGWKVDCACFVRKTEPRPPEWARWLSEGFAFGELVPETQSSGCVILLRIDGRLFAVCFGTGRHLIASQFIEQAFGLTVALREVDPKLLRTLVTKTIDVRTRQRDTHQVSGGEVGDFAVNLDVEWLRSAEGRTAREDCTVVAGAHSLQLHRWRRPLRELPMACREFLAIYARGMAGSGRAPAAPWG